MADTIDWPGKSGKTYTYWFIPGDIDSPSLKAVAGNYMFVKKLPDGWVPVYIGQSGDLNERHSDHPEVPCVKRNGGTHLMAHTTPGGKDARLAEEKDLVDHWNPPCNG